MATVEVSVKGLDAAIDLLKRNSKNVDRFLERLCEVGQNAAQSAFGGGGSVIVAWSKANDGYVITANGQAVMFLEFGAGIYTDETHEFASQMPFDVAPGSYSQTVGQGQFIPGVREFWYLGHTRIEGVQPRRGMWLCYKAMEDNLSRVWQEVMG